jgi:hypothetical protein
VAQPQPQPELQIKIYQDDIEPFWKKLPEFFAYPFRFTPMVVIGVLSLVSILTAVTGGLLRGLLAYLFLRYAFSVMEQSATGDFNSESPDISMWGGKDHRPFKQTVVFIFYALVVMGLAVVSAVPVVSKEARALHAAQQQAAQEIQLKPGVDPTAPRPKAKAEETEDDEEPQAAPERIPQSYAEAMAMSAAALPAEPEPDDVRFPPWFYALAILAAIPLPGAIMVIAIEDSLVRALNPATTFFFIRAMGKSYFILWGFFALILTVREAIMHATANLAAYIRLPIEMFVGSYLMLALFAMMGYVLYQYHQELGYEVKVDFDSHREKAATAASGKPVDPMTQQVNAFVKEGRLDEALRYVHDAMRYDKLNPDMNERLHELYKLKGEPEKTVAHGQQYLQSLVAAKRGPKALTLLKRLREMDAKFEPHADARLALATAAMAARDTHGAVDLVKGFDKRFPEHADIPAVYLLGAKITSEHLHQDEKAMAILKALLQRYPNASVKEEAEKYLAVLANMAKLKTTSKPVPAAALAK